MPHPNPHPPCIFCGAKANSREHAIPAWISKRFGIKAMMHPVYAFGIKQPRKQPVSFANHRERIFCKGCNTHFKHLEDEAIPVLEWMGRGRSINLGSVEQDVLARWGAKTGYALIAAERDLREFIPTEHTRLLRYENRVHPNTWVGYASWQGRAHKSAGDHSLESLKPGEETAVRAYGAVLTFAGLALKVFGLFDPVPRHVLAYDSGSLKQVWPRLDRHIAWPLWPAAGDANIQKIAELPPLTPTA